MSIETGRILDALDSAQRPVRTVINVALAVVIGMFLAKIFWAIFAPAPTGAKTVSGELPRPLVENKATLIVDRTVLFKKNFFKGSEREIVVDEDAPETTLNLKLEGVTAPSTAYIVLPNNERKRFQSGEQVSEGVELIAIESDRVVLSRDGNTEVLLLNPTRQTNIVPFVQERSDQTRSSKSRKVLNVSGSRDQFFANVSVETVARSNGDYLQLFPKGSKSAFERLNFKSGDIVLEAGGIEGTDFDQLAELVSREDNLFVIIEREGLPVEINIRFLP